MKTCKNCMKQIIQVVLFSIFLISCSTGKYYSANRSSTIDPNYWNIPADLSKIVYEGGDGSSLENAIIIRNATTTRDGIAAEYAYIEKKHGQRFNEWKPMGQSTNTQNGSRYDVIIIQITSDNTTIKYIFDITEFYGKF